MAGLLSNVGEEQMLKLLCNKAGVTLRDMSLRLFKNDYTPVETSIVGDFTVANFTGYASQTLGTADWTITPGAPTSAACGQKTFTSTAGSQNQPIYGYYLVTVTDEIFVAGERFSDGPYTVVNNGDAIKVTPNITQD
jgi:hypothetical protein